MQDKNSIENQSIEELVNHSLDDSIENLSPQVRRGLTQSRILATKLKPGFSPIWKLAGGISFLFVVSFSWQFIKAPKPELMTPFAAVLTEDLEMLDDLEFVYWLTEESDSATL